MSIYCSRSDTYDQRTRTSGGLTSPAIDLPWPQNEARAALIERTAPDPSCLPFESVRQGLAAVCAAGASVGVAGGFAEVSAKASGFASAWGLNLESALGWVFALPFVSAGVGGLRRSGARGKAASARGKRSRLWRVAVAARLR